MQMIIAIGIYLAMGRPVFFLQTRPGQHGKPFLLIKFRTMTTTSHFDVGTQRITRLGKWLRARSLDELPELLNVIKGDMSLVGPRPLLMEYLPLYSEEDRRRHDVKPGITGWAQVKGRNTLTWEQKFELDIWYVKHRSPILDLRILCLTVVAVIRGSGINQSDHTTMERFRGYER